MSDQSTAIVPIAIRVERELTFQPELVFNAYADIDQRAQWLPPSDENVVFESQDFRVGGTDHFIRGRRQSPSCAGTIRYEQIVDNSRMVFTERLVDSDGELRAISVITWNIDPSGDGALLTVTDQTTSVVGSGPIEGCKYNYEVMLDRLTGHLAEST